MPYTTVMDLDFNPANYPQEGSADALAEALNWWSFMNGGAVGDTVAGHLSPETFCHPAFVDDGADSHLLFSFATPSQLVEVAGAYATKAAMDADLVPGNGVKVNCFDPDPTKRGRYAKSGGTGTGSWVLDGDGVIRDKAWNDYNHPQRLLELLICTFIYTATPLPVMGSQMGYRGIADGNWTNARLTLDIGCRMLELGPWGKIGMHIQGNVPARAALLTALYGEGDKYFVPNFIKTDQLLSDLLGFSNLPTSWGLPNDTPIVHTNRVSWVIDFVPDDTLWHCLGDRGRDPTGREVNYGADSISKVLDDVHGNAFVLHHNVTPNDGGTWWTGNNSAATIADFDRVRGDLLFYGATLESWAE